jgi:hypothetical protein
MLDLSAPVGARTAGPLPDATTADAIWQELPRTDPVTAQKALSEALARLATQHNPGVDRLQALLVLDRQAQALFDVLLINFVLGDAGPPALERSYWQAAFELSRSFGRVYGNFMRSVRDRQHYRRWRECLPSMLVRLFQHRQSELLLRPFVDGHSAGFSWMEMHEAYRYAHSLGLLAQRVSVTRCRTQRAAESTPEREYVHVLVQQLMNRGHFSPHEAFWAAQQIPQWCEPLTLQPRARGGEPRFIVDLDADAGPVVSTVESAGARLCLDTDPALASIDHAITSLRDLPNHSTGLSASRRSRQLKLLRKVALLLMPAPPQIARRGERTPVALSVEIIIGLAQIVGALRRKRRGVPPTAPPIVPETQTSTFTAFGGFTGMRTTGLVVARDTSSLTSSGDAETESPLWQLVDRSDSGCRLQGPVFDSNWVIPGTLIAFREDVASPWTLAIVRRAERRADNWADIGVEYLGKHPRGVKITVAAASGQSEAGAPDGEPTSFAALYLPESSTHPVMPVKTLVLPARGFAPDDRLILRSVTTFYTIQLKDPIEEQGSFVWSPFDIIDRRARDASASSEDVAAG